MIHFIHKNLKKISLILSTLIVCSVFVPAFPCVASSSIVIPTSTTENWPTGPVINAESAILMELETGTILYAKNIHTKQYPASITKILTTYVATTNSSSNDQITMSYNAVNSIEWWSDANINIKTGNSITMEEALYAVMVASANEVAYAIAEHISGSIADFSNLMNDTATQLGALNSNFINPNGIHDDDHYTTAYDMAMIASAYFKNDFHCILSSTPSYTIPQTSTQPSDSMSFTSKNRLFSGQTYAYEYLIGSKTGYTSMAQQTLVSAARRNGMTLICVVLNAEAPYQFEDTLSLFQYGFGNFQIHSVLDNDTTYSIHNTDFFNTVSSDLGASKSILSFAPSTYIVLPIQASFDDTTSILHYNTDDSYKAVATVDYIYNGIPVGNAPIYSTFTPSNIQYFDYGEESFESTVSFVETALDQSTIILNVKYTVLSLVGIGGILILIFFLKEKIQSYTYSTGYSPYLRRRRSKFKQKTHMTKNPIVIRLRRKLFRRRRHRGFR
ncbi:MAG: D-alanyl-D-alanine carboxypeptidase family protein [Eubacteriales bacterium]